MKKELSDEKMHDLFEAIASLQNAEECREFFEDLCTVNELLAMRQLFWVADLLNNHLVYTEIGEQTGASSTTITRVNRCLSYGSGGYVKALERKNSK